MNKLTLLGIATQPKYDDDDRWIGADIFASIEAEIEDGEQRGLHRFAVNLTISPTLIEAVKSGGYTVRIEKFLMKRVKACLRTCPKEWPGTEQDIDTIYEAMREKMPLFVAKSIDRNFYTHNFRTGEIGEYGEDTLDRNIKQAD